MLCPCCVLVCLCPFCGVVWFISVSCSGVIYLCFVPWSVVISVLCPGLCYLRFVRVVFWSAISPYCGLVWFISVLSPGMFYRRFMFWQPQPQLVRGAPAASGDDDVDPAVVVVAVAVVAVVMPFRNTKNTKEQGYTQATESIIVLPTSKHVPQTLRTMQDSSTLPPIYVASPNHDRGPRKCDVLERLAAKKCVAVVCFFRII